MGKWLKGCELCNSGLVVEMDRLIESGISVNKAAKMLAEEGERKIGDLVYTQAAIRARYRYFKGLREPHPKKVGQSDQPKKEPSTSTKSGKKSPEVVNAEEPEPSLSIIEIENFETDVEKLIDDVELTDAQKKSTERIGKALQVLKKLNEPVRPDLPEFSSIHIRTTAKEASKSAERASITPLQRISIHAKALSRGLEGIIDGRVKSEGPYDNLFAESIKRKGPGIIMSYYQLGIDPQKAIDFYHGRKSDDTKNVKGKSDKQANLRSATAIENHSEKKK
jgi:hypothetical protein